jgi:hypothetical protein
MKRAISGNPEQSGAIEGKPVAESVPPVVNPSPPKMPKGTDIQKYLGRKPGPKSIAEMMKVISNYQMAHRDLPTSARRRHVENILGWAYPRLAMDRDANWEIAGIAIAWGCDELTRLYHEAQTKGEEWSPEPLGERQEAPANEARHSPLYS